ncbi:MAG: tetratricopeptide repeat protein [Planctomycetes bacterium]|nr:tetratricopeptide repeat protein [Planctomycetota bacterium]
MTKAGDRGEEGERLNAGAPTEIDSGDGPTRIDPKAPLATPIGTGRRPAGTGRIRYRIQSVLGRGGMGEVLLAYDPELRRRVALKRIREEAAGHEEVRARFVEEAQITAQLDHPNVVPVHELGMDPDGQPFYAMKEVRGETLGDKIAAGTTSLPQLLRVFVKVCEAVGFAHSRGVLHRDLKPANVMVGDFGEVYVMDWGLAKLLGSGNDSRAARIDTDRYESREALTGAGGIVGTLSYLSPEQAGVGGDLSRASDVYLLGGILYEILTGTPPHLDREGSGKPALLVRIGSEPVEAPSTRAPERRIPRELEAVARKALERDPAARYAGVADLQADIEAYLDGRIVGAARYGALETAWRWVRAHRPVVGIALAIFFTAAAIQVYLIVQEKREAAAARARALALDPPGMLARAAGVLREIPSDPTERSSPDAAEKESARELLEELRALSEAWADALRLDPSDEAVRRGLYETLLAMGRLAEASEDYTLARFAFGQAAGLSADDGEASRLKSGVEKAEGALLARHRQRIEFLLSRAEEGELDPERVGREAYEDAKIELASYRERQTVEILVASLAGITERMRRRVRETVLAAGEPDAEERQAGAGTIEGLESAVGAWMEGRVPAAAGGTPLRIPEAQERIVQMAFDRIANREARRPRERHRQASAVEILARAQGDELREKGLDGRTLLALTCETLGLLGDPRGAVEALGFYLWTELDESRAVPAGIALVRLGGEGSLAETTLLELVGLAAGIERPPPWSIDGEWWGRVKRELARRGRRAGAAAPPDSRGATDHLRRGRILAAQGDLDGAIAEYGRAIELDPRLVKAYLGRGAARQEKGDFEGALEDQDRAVELAPQEAAAFNNRGMAKLALGDLEGAILDYTRAIELDPLYMDFRMNRGNAFTQRCDYAKAIEDFDRAIELDPQSAVAWFDRGVACYYAGDLEAAIRDYTRAVEIDSGLAPAFDARGRARSDGGDLDGAIADFTRAIELDPASLEPWLHRGDARVAMRDYDLAIKEFEYVLSIDPRSARAFFGRGRARLGKGDAEGAILDFTSVLSIEPAWGAAYNNRAYARFLLGEFDESIADANRAIEIDPERPVWYVTRGEARAAQGDLAGAIADHTRAIEIDPGLALAYRNRAGAHLALGDLPAATADATRAIELEPEIADAYVTRAAARRTAGNLAGASGDVDAALVLDPRSARAHLERSRMCEARGDRDAAIAACARAIEIDPGFLEAWDDHVGLLERAGRATEAAEARERAALLRTQRDRKRR